MNSTNQIVVANLKTIPVTNTANDGVGIMITRSDHPPVVDLPEQEEDITMDKKYNNKAEEEAMILSNNHLLSSTIENNKGKEPMTQEQQPPPVQMINYCSCKHIVPQYKCSSYQNLTAIMVPPYFHNKAILILGDSVPWEMSQALKCVVDRNAGSSAISNLKIVFHGMHLFHIHEHEFKATLDQLIRQQEGEVAAVIFGIGIWYNWQWGVPLASFPKENKNNKRKRWWKKDNVPNRIPVNGFTTARILNEECPSSLQTYLNKNPYNASIDPFTRAKKIRKYCTVLLG